MVFSTKNRMPWLVEDIREKVCLHIMQNCKEKEIFLQTVNGYTEHIHCLVSLGRQQTIADVAQSIKGESSFWINNKLLMPEKFSWQDDYFAVSVSESQVKTVVAYIQNQETHHSRKSFDDEVKEFMNNYGWNILSDGGISI